MVHTPTITRIAKAMLASGKLDFRTAVLRLGLTGSSINTGIDNPRKLADITLLGASGNYPAGGYALQNVALAAAESSVNITVHASNVTLEGMSSTTVNGAVIYAAGTFTDVFQYGEVSDPIIAVIDIFGTYGVSAIIDGGYGFEWANGALFYIG